MYAWDMRSRSFKYFYLWNGEDILVFKERVHMMNLLVGNINLQIVKKRGGMGVGGSDKVCMNGP